MNINLNEEQKKNIENKFLEFQKIWTLEKVKSMSLEEYTNLKHENPNYYCYWLDVLLKEYAGFGGNDAGKFGIYRYKKPPKKDDYLYDNRYAWRKNLGNTKDEVFEKVKKEIVKVIEYSQNNNLKCIDKEILNEILPFGLKWKIAFHYQNPNDIKIVNIFKKDILEAICKNEFKSNLEIYELHKKLLKDKIYTLDSMRNEVSVPLWGHYSNLNTKTIEQNKINFSIYLNKVTKKDGSKLSEGTKENYIEDISRISTKYLNVNLYKCDIKQFDLKCKELENNKKYLDQNFTNKNRYSSAIKYYRDFLINSSDKEFYNNKETNKGLNVENPPLNQILYGPPGTGKTYHTIDKALEILGENLASRHEKKAKFDEYVKNGQIVFTTFHQSYGYEEFVEGIKPIIDNDENSQELKYEIKNGVFKELCDKSLKNYISSIQNENETDLDKLIFEFANYINQNYLDKGNEFPLENKVNVKKILLNSKDEYRSFLLGGSIKSPQRLTIDVIKRDYLDFINGRILSFKDIKPKYDSQSDYHGNATYYFMFYKKLKEFEGLQNEKFKIKKDNLKPYIIIIDEINRGNVSKIFGELITLIEPSKRIGESEGLKVTLPYSGEKFGVPKNVYIVGTMNTADRSITSLDTALRRRFEFVEMMPDAEELEKSKYKDVNLKKLLEAINTRIEYLLDREKTIGHAFFIGVENLNNLKNVFQNKIIPLLQEYFYNDYALIDAVLNKNGMLEKQDINNNYLKNMTEIIESDKVIYKFSDSQKWDENTFKKIYE
ncbi:endonuclease [Campylobacter lari]|uniref:McrB family protein n=1 Tax=Campylobacter lari TaxID=201 RepID=UPI00127F0920|nr:AAA family ATPase [Campylobacter lari]EAI3897028.1 endonuclease [Campylobacter lari]EAJ5696345.1 endonuclease [Campylobacter lari]EAJ5698017.1 endonuclease [Campylobacter lari]EAL3890487.1 endonuclease [Campylobacter lari]EHC7929439.1 AAA domain-containing protein [Campylobacter lari]